MGHVDKMERQTKEMNDLISCFEKNATKKGLNIQREDNSPVGYWYCCQETNTAFYWFMSGTSYGKLISR